MSPENYSDAVAYTRQWLIDRLDWLDNTIPSLVPDVDEPFYFGPSSMLGVLDLRGFQQIDYPITLEMFSTAGQLLYESKIINKAQPIAFDANGIVFFRSNTARRPEQTGILFLR